jgi:hypothetical protein
MVEREYIVDPVESATQCLATWPPSSDTAILAGREHELLLINDAETAHKLRTMGSWKPHNAVLVQAPGSVLGQMYQVKHLFAASVLDSLSTV